MILNSRSPAAGSAVTSRARTDAPAGPWPAQSRNISTLLFCSLDFHGDGTIGSVSNPSRELQLLSLLPRSVSVPNPLHVTGYMEAKPNDRVFARHSVRYLGRTLTVPWAFD